MTIHSPRNRTLSLTDAEEKYYFGLCKTASDEVITDSIICGDSFEIIGKIPEHSISLIISDPPYNLSKVYAGKNFRKMNDSDYKDFTEELIKASKRILKKNGSIYICCDWRDSSIFSEVLSRHFYIKNRITWQRDKGRGNASNWKNCMEDIWYAVADPKNYTFNLDAVKQRRSVLAPYKTDGQPKDWVETADGRFRDTCPSNFWDDISIPYWSMPENTEHPTQKPEKLAAKLILASSNPEDLVLDPFLGSGTTAVAAKKLKRHFIGIESEPRYCALAAKRLEAAESDKTIQGYSDGVFWERNTSFLQQKYKKSSDK
ncbi:MAG: site-specific DNA-methyltransferase [Ruminococcus sp.]|jgi:site-specific DNA-methyltransferase (adenine-specific)|nr:site-specific DNA-methyltransferase [Ruminococcus sp.]